MALQESTYNAALQNTPMNTYDMRSVGSTYATVYAGVSTTLLLAPDIRPDIIPAFPKQFTDIVARRQGALSGCAGAARAVDASEAGLLAL